VLDVPLVRVQERDRLGGPLAAQHGGVEPGGAEEGAYELQQFIGKYGAPSRTGPGRRAGGAGTRTGTGSSGAGAGARTGRRSPAPLRSAE
ncbi:hypothetical protein ABT398_36080, partial [Streptomyces hydrogenans]